MKHIYTVVALIIVAGIFFSCKGRRSEEMGLHNLKIVTNFNTYPSEDFNPKILNIVSAYLDSINKERRDSLKVCRLFVEQKDLNISYKLSVAVHYSSILNDLPQGYLSFDDMTILIYTGLEKLYGKQEKIPEELADELNGKLVNDLMSDLKTIDPEFQPGLYSYPTWEVKLQEDSLIVNKMAEPVQRIKTIIYQLPDTITN